MLRVGLTGPAGSGKSTLAALLAARGFPVIDADGIAHALYSPGTPLAAVITAAFGDAVADGRGGIDRRALGDAVFADPARLDRLNAIVHPPLVLELDRRLRELAAAGVPAAVVDAALLLQWGAALPVDLVIGVTAPREERRRRLIAAGMDPARAERRLDAQVSDALLRRRADLLIDNGGDPGALEREADRIAAEIHRRGGRLSAPPREGNP
jgi:dephospho-CoA kinase